MHRERVAGHVLDSLGTVILKRESIYVFVVGRGHERFFPFILQVLKETCVLVLLRSSCAFVARQVWMKRWNGITLTGRDDTPTIVEQTTISQSAKK